MNREEILAMEAGPELNALLAVNLLGWKWESRAWWTPTDHPAIRQFNVYRFLVGPNGERPLTYCTGEVVDVDMSHEVLCESAVPPLSETWEGMRLVVEAMAREGWELELRDNHKRAIAGFHRCGVCRRAKRQFAPHAVALAAMLAAGGGDA